MIGSTHVGANIPVGNGRGVGVGTTVSLGSYVFLAADRNSKIRYHRSDRHKKTLVFRLEEHSFLVK